MDPINHSRWILSTNGNVECSPEVLLLRRLPRTYLWWAKHGWYMVGYWCKLIFSPDLLTRAWYLLLSSKSELPTGDVFPHCYLPLHFWLDKGLVTRRVKKYPMLLRPAWLPRQIRNASGNGGGVLLGYMPIVSYTKCLFKINSHVSWIQIEDPSDPTSRLGLFTSAGHSWVTLSTPAKKTRHYLTCEYESPVGNGCQRVQVGNSINTQVLVYLWVNLLQKKIKKSTRTWTIDGVKPCGTRWLDVDALPIICENGTGDWWLLVGQKLHFTEQNKN